MFSSNERFRGKPSPPRQGVRFAELLNLHDFRSAQHLVQFYEDASPVIDNVAYLTARTLAACDAAVIVATQVHLDEICERLSSAGLELNSHLESGCLVLLEAEQTLAQFMIERQPDRSKFIKSVGATMHETAQRSANDFVFVFGEMVALLCLANNPSAAIHLERLWNDLAGARRFSLYCAYSMNSLGCLPHADTVMRICDEHSLTVPGQNSL